MIDILVVDDATVDRRVVAHVLKAISDCRVHIAADAESALECLDTLPIDLVVADLHLPDLNGLDLLAEIRVRELETPFVIMTSSGSERMAIEALRRGATNYVLKNELAVELVPICESVLAMTEAKNEADSVVDSVVSGRIEFELCSDRSRAVMLARHLQAVSGHALDCDHATRTRIGIALEEALLNAIVHGNLEVSSELREHGDGSFEELIAQRQAESPYRDRVVRVVYAWDEYSVCFAIEDEGAGFDVDNLPDPTDPENLLRASGRGVLLMNSFMDRVQFDGRGNRVVMIKYKTITQAAKTPDAEAVDNEPAEAAPTRSQAPRSLPGPHAARERLLSRADLRR